jgi:hypothetical protein
MKALVLVLSALGTVACGFIEAAPNPTPIDATSSQSSGPGGRGGAGGTGPVVRTVTVQSPWGGPAGNLLVDGDFELSIALDGHETPSAWFTFSTVNDGERYLRGETGGLCKTGLRCAVLEANTVLFGRGAAAPFLIGMTSSLWAKPPLGAGCELIEPWIVECDQATLAHTLAPDAAVPDGDGWCRYQGSVPKSARQVCMYIDSKLEGNDTALVDAATLLPNPQNTSLASAAPLSGK